MRILRTVVSTSMVALAVVCAGCSKDDLGIVKEGHLQIDKSVAIGKALDGYQYFGTKEWQALKDERMGRVVVFKAEMSPAFIKELNDTCLKSDPKQKKIDGQKWSIQFSIGKDDTVNISGTQTLTTFSDKTEKAGSLNEALMQSVYKNELAAVCQ